MPAHDWTRVEPGVFHALHNTWISTIQQAMNDGLLPPEYYALGEQRSGNYGPDVLTLEIESDADGPDWSSASPVDETGGGTLTSVESPPKTRFEMECELDAAFYQTRQRSIKVRHVSDDRVVAIIEIVSSGNKRSQFALIDFIDKAITAFREGVHLMVLDLYPPRRFDPDGMHGVIWNYLNGDEGEHYVHPKDEPLTLASYVAANPIRSYVEPVAVGATLREMPLFLTWERYVNVPLEETYMAAYRGLPRRFKQILEQV